MTSQHNAVAPTSGNKNLLHQTNNFANVSANRVHRRNLPEMERGIPETSGMTNYGVINNYGPVTISLNQCGQNGHQGVQGGAVVPFYGNFDGRVCYPTVSSQQNATNQRSWTALERTKQKSARVEEWQISKIERLPLVF